MHQEHFTNHFFPREDIIRRLASEVQDQALQQVDHLASVLEAMESKREQNGTLPAAKQGFAYPLTHNVPAAVHQSFDTSGTQKPGEDAKIADRGGAPPSISERLFSLLMRAVSRCKRGLQSPN